MIDWTRIVRHGSVIGSAVAALLLATACGGHACMHEEVMTLSLRADLRCPSTEQVERELQLSDGSVSARSAVARPAKTFCWYRLPGGAMKIPCLDRPKTTGPGFLSRRYYLAKARSSGHGRAADYYESASYEAGEYLTSCDEDGLLYADVNQTSETSDPCPATMRLSPAWPSADDKLTTASFVGRDVYPARVTCDYRATTQGTCQGGGGGFGNILPGPGR